MVPRVDVKLRPFFPYFGGKFRLAPKYPKPRWSTIIEPFAGSAGYSVRYHTRNVILYDLNAEVYCTWDYLIRVSAAEILRLPLVFDDVRDLNIPQEARWLISWWLGPGDFAPRPKPQRGLSTRRIKSPENTIHNRM